MFMRFLRDGWKTTTRQSGIILFLFAYQVAWGIYLYKFMNAIIVPLMHRFPGSELNERAVQLYWAEAQFQLLKTDLIHSYLGILIAVLCVRMLLTPLINAGLYHSIHHPGIHAAFRNGIRVFGLSFTLLYLLQTVLILSPLYWLIPNLIQAVSKQSTYESAAMALVPYAAGFLLYSAIVSFVFMYIQLAKLTGDPWILTFKVILRWLMPAAGISLVLFLLAGAAALLTTAVSLIWAGFAAVLIHQLYPLFRIFFSIWAISSQYHLWIEKK